MTRPSEFPYSLYSLLLHPVKAIGIIPSRYASTRFPGKPLADIKGKTMVRRVYEQASKCSHLECVYVATEDQRIVDEVLSFGGNVLMTSPEHPSGTDRCFEVLEKLGMDKYDVVINIQGDEPYIHPEQIDTLVNIFKNEKVEIATLAHNVTNPADLENPNIVKIVRNVNGEALYFSRSVIPYLRQASGEPWTNQFHYLKHIGLSIFSS